MCSALAACAIACGASSSPSAPSAPGGTGTAAPSGPPTITITSAGVSPVEVSVGVGRRVAFVNNDSIPHDVAGGPEPARPDCREIDAVGFLTPGQRRETQPFPAARTCEFHDHGFHSPIFNGRIVIQ